MSVNRRAQEPAHALRKVGHELPSVVSYDVATTAVVPKTQKVS